MDLLRFGLALDVEFAGEHGLGLSFDQGCVDSLRYTVPGSASFCSREARLTVSPSAVTAASWLKILATTASPELTPMRICGRLPYWLSNVDAAAARR